MFNLWFWSVIGRKKTEHFKITEKSIISAQNVWYQITWTMIQMLHMVSLEKNFITSKIVGPHYKNAFIPVMVPAHNMRTKKILLIFGNICQTFNLVLESNFFGYVAWKLWWQYPRNFQIFGGKCKFMVPKKTFWHSWKNVSVV